MRSQLGTSGSTNRLELLVLVGLLVAQKVAAWMAAVVMEEGRLVAALLGEVVPPVSVVKGAATMEVVVRMAKAEVAEVAMKVGVMEVMDAMD